VFGDFGTCFSLFSVISGRQYSLQSISCKDSSLSYLLCVECDVKLYQYPLVLIIILVMDLCGLTPIPTNTNDNICRSCDLSYAVWYHKIVMFVCRISGLLLTEYQRQAHL